MEFNETALEFWNEHFRSQTQTSVPLFLDKFRQFVRKYASLYIDDTQAALLISMIDATYTSSIHFCEFCIFFEKFWSIASNRVHIYKYLFKPASINPFETEVQLLKLQVIKSPSKNFPESIEINPKNLSSNKIAFSYTLGCDSQVSDFELTDDFKINPAHIRFHFNKLKVFVHDVSRSERTKIRVQTFPIKLSESMIIQVGMNNFLKVKMIQPSILCEKEQLIQLDTSITDFEDDVIQFRTAQKQHQIMTALDYIKIKDLQKKQEMHIQQYVMGICELEFIEGEFKGKSFTIEPNTNKDNWVFGREEKSEFRFKDITVQNRHCVIKYSQDLGFYIIEEKSTRSIGTFVYLANQNQIKLKQPSNVQQIHQNTILKVGEYQFKVIIIDKNYDEFAY